MKIEQFYADNIDRLIKFTMNQKKGGDGLYVTYDDAVDIVNNTFEYFVRRPDKFKAKWVWNTLMQRRRDFIAKSSSYGRMKKGLWEWNICIEEAEPDGDMGDTLDMYTFAHYIKDEIGNIKSKRVRDILTAYLIDGDSFSRKDRYKYQVVYRFRKAMLEKYGGEDNVKTNL